MNDVTKRLPNAISEVHALPLKQFMYLHAYHVISVEIKVHAGQIL